MKSFFNYFRSRERVEKTGNRSGNSAERPSASPSVNEESAALQIGSQSNSSSSGRNLVHRQVSSIRGRKGPEVRAIILELGDFLKRIPPEFLRPGDHQITRELRFGIEEVANNIARGKATIPLSEIVKQCPEVFRDSIVGRDNIDIFFPWQKLARQFDALVGYRSRTECGKKEPEESSAGPDPAAQGSQAASLEPNRLESPLQTVRLKKSERVDSVTKAGIEEMTSAGETQADALRAQMAEFLAEREKILLELENTRSKLEDVRNECAKLRDANASREALERQVETLHRQLQEAVEAEDNLNERLRMAEADARSIEILRRELEKAAEGRHRAVKELEVTRAEMQTLREAGAGSRRELVVHAAEIEKAKGFAEARVRELEQHIVHLDSKFEAWTLERDESEGEASPLRGHHAKLIASLKSERDNAFNSRDELRDEMKRIREEFQKKIDTLTGEREALKRDKLQFNSQVDQLRANHRKQIEFLNGDTEKRVAALKKRVDIANAERNKLVWELRSQREQFNAEIEDLRLDRIALAKARDEAIDQERETRKELEEELGRLKQERDLLVKE